MDQVPLLVIIYPNFPFVIKPKLAVHIKRRLQLAVLSHTISPYLTVDLRYQASNFKIQTSHVKWTNLKHLIYIHAINMRLNRRAGSSSPTAPPDRSKESGLGSSQQ